MNCRIPFLIVVLMLSSFGWAQKANPPKPDASALLQEVAATYAHIGNANVHIEGIEERTTTTELERDWHKTYGTLIRGKGNRFRLETRTPFGSWTDVSDGTTEWIYWADANRYMQRPLVGGKPFDFKVLFGGNEKLSEAWNGVIFLERQAADSRDAKLLSDERITLNGHKFPCYVVWAQGPGKLLSSRIFWIDKQDHIFRKIVEHNQSYMIDADNVHLPFIEDDVTTYPIVDLNASMPDSVFHFTPPVGAKLVDHLGWPEHPAPRPALRSTKIHPIPNIHLTDSSGKTTPLSSYRGKVLLIDFWATWCGPCITTMPEFAKFVAKYRTSGLTAITIDEDSDPHAALHYLKLNGYTWANYHDRHDALLHAFHGIGIPLVVLIDKNGDIIFQDNTGDYDAALSAALEREFPKAHVR